MEEIILVGLGLIFGSFLNVVIHRMPLNQSLITPGSHCPACNYPIKFYDNIPVISYLILLGRCRHCKTTISPRYPAVELLTATCSWLAYLHFQPNLIYIAFAFLFICLLIALALIDMEHMILPLELTIGGAIIFMAYSFFNPFLSPLQSFGAAFGSAILFTGLYFFYVKVRKIEGLGQGDIWMMLLLGAFLGVEKLVVAVLLATLSGLMVGLYFIIIKKKNLKHALPFGTFLALGSLIALFWGNDIMQWLQALITPGS